MTKRVAIADMVYLTNDREGIVRFKGKTGFALGEWYGIELRTNHKTRHDGLIHGKRYFRCPRNKGLFVRRQIIVDVMDKRTAEQKTRVFKMGGTARGINKKIHRKYQTKAETTKKKKKKKPKKEIIKKEQKCKGKQSKTKIEDKRKKKDDINEDEEERKDFSSKESFSNPKSRKYFGKDQVFTGLDRRRSRYEDILLMDPVALVVHDTKKTTTELGTKRRDRHRDKKKKENKRRYNNKNKLKPPEEEMKKKERIEYTSQYNYSPASTASTASTASNTSTEYSPFIPSPIVPSPSPSPKSPQNKKYRPFGGDASPNKKQLTAPLHIKQISMEFSKGNLKAKLKKVTTTKRKKRQGTIKNVYEKYSAKADYPILDDLRNETLVSEFLSFSLYSLYRSESNLVNDYTIDRAIGCGCFYVPDPIGFRLADFKTYEVFQDLCDELLCILHDEWNPKDRPHKKDTDWRSLITQKALPSIESPNNVLAVKMRRNRTNSSVDAKKHGMLQMVHNMKEKRRKSKRRPVVSLDEDTEINIKDKRKSHHKRGRFKDKSSMHVRSSLQNSSFMMARMSLWDNDYVSSCRITLSRNLHGFRFSNVISRSERRNLEKMLSQCLNECNEGALKGRYRPYSKINKQKIPLLIETDKLFPKPDAPGLIMAGYARDWPESRGIFINYNKNLYIWCNYLEHLHLISVQNDGNVLMAFKRLFDSEQKLESLMKQRQEIFLTNLRLKQKQIIERDLTVSSPIVIATEMCLVPETPTKEEEYILIKKEEEKDIKKKKRLTKQEYRIKKLNITALETGFVYDDELGYISSNPQYFGTSMRVYVTVKLPNLIKHEKFNDILEIRNLTAYQHDVHSAQQMFMAYASQLPSKTQLTMIKQRRSSAGATMFKVSQKPNINKLKKIPSSQTTHNHDNQLSAQLTDDKQNNIDKQKTNRRSSNPGITTNYKRSKQNTKNISIIREKVIKKKKYKKKDKPQTMDDNTDFMSNLNLPDIDGSNKDKTKYNEPKVSLKILTHSMQKYKSAPIEEEKEEKKEKEHDDETVLIHDDEDLGDVVDPTHYKEEITIYQTVSLGISEVDQVRSMIEAINYLIEFEKLLSAGKSLGERLNVERLKKANIRN